MAGPEIYAPVVPDTLVRCKINRDLTAFSDSPARWFVQSSYCEHENTETGLGMIMNILEEFHTLFVNHAIEFSRFRLESTYYNPIFLPILESAHLFDFSALPDIKSMTLAFYFEAFRSIFFSEAVGLCDIAVITGEINSNIHEYRDISDIIKPVSSIKKKYQVIKTKREIWKNKNVLFLYCSTDAEHDTFMDQYLRADNEWVTPVRITNFQHLLETVIGKVTGSVFKAESGTGKMVEDKYIIAENIPPILTAHYETELESLEVSSSKGGIANLEWLSKSYRFYYFKCLLQKYFPGTEITVTAGKKGVRKWYLYDDENKSLLNGSIKLSLRKRETESIDDPQDWVLSLKFKKVTNQPQEDWNVVFSDVSEDVGLTDFKTLVDEYLTDKKKEELESKLKNGAGASINEIKLVTSYSVKPFQFSFLFAYDTRDFAFINCDLFENQDGSALRQIEFCFKHSFFEDKKMMTPRQLMELLHAFSRIKQDFLEHFFTSAIEKTDASLRNDFLLLEDFFYPEPRTIYEIMMYGEG